MAAELARSEDGNPVRIWSAGCANGQEAYSLAILLREYLGAQARSLRVQVFATDIDETKLGALKSEGIAEVAKLDARDSAAVAAMAKRAGKTDILLNAAGFVHHGTVLDCSDEDWDFSFDLNVKSMHRTIRAFLPGMLREGFGLTPEHADYGSFASFADP